MNTINTYFNTLFYNWKTQLQIKSFRNQFILTMLSYVFLFKYCRLVMTIFENRKGVQIFDKFLALLPPIDSSNIIFVLTYSVLTIFILANVINPVKFLKAMQAYTLLMIMRTITIYLVPLEPPIGMILLKDTISNFFMSGESGKYIVKDLFFSGHVSTAMLFFIITENKTLKKILLGLSISIAVLILFQHVHYLIDVVAAPFFSLLAYTTIMLVHKESPLPVLFPKKYSKNN